MPIGGNVVTQYHAPGNGEESELRACTIEQLTKWSTDPNCVEKDKCAAHLQERLVTKRTLVEQNPFDPRTEISADAREISGKLQLRQFDPRTDVSADAKYIAKRLATHLWILFVLLPLTLAILFNILK